jgi:hypothetical protein
MMEATSGFEPLNRGFAELRRTLDKSSMSTMAAPTSVR